MSKLQSLLPNRFLFLLHFICGLGCICPMSYRGRRTLILHPECLLETLCEDSPYLFWGFVEEIFD